MATILSCLFVAVLITALQQRSVGFEKITHLIAAFVFAAGLSLLAQYFLPSVAVSGIGFDLGLLGTVAGAFLGNWLVDRYQPRLMDYLEEQLGES